MDINGTTYSWTQPSCDTCYADLYPGREPLRMKEEYRESEQCCMCGKATASGIYCRVNPSEVPHPTPEVN
jgi:hypothetical protein